MTELAQNMQNTVLTCQVRSRVVVVVIDPNSLPVYNWNNNITL